MRGREAAAGDGLDGLDGFAGVGDGGDELGSDIAGRRTGGTAAGKPHDGEPAPDRGTAGR